MKTSKHLLLLLLTLIMVFSLCCCNKKNQTGTETTVSTSDTTEIVPGTSVPDETDDPVVTTTEPDVTETTQPPQTTTEPLVTTPEPVVTTPEPVVTTPEPIVTTPEPVVTTPEPIETTTPEPVVTTPEPVETTTEPHVHSYTWKTQRGATCTESGLRIGTCECGETSRRTIAANGHDWDDGKVTTEPTCVTEGVKTYTCEDCSETKTEAVPAGGHSYDEGVVKTPHTCTTDGEKLFTCSVCHETKTEVIPMAHAPKLVAAVAHTCTTNGNYAYYKCEACSRLFWEEACTNEITDPTATIDPAAHASVAIPDVAPTCTTPGQMGGTKCEVCGNQLTAPTVLDAKHTPVTDAAVAPTCTETGLTEGVHCDVCKVVLTKPQTVPATGHTFKAENYVSNNDATCTKDGTKTAKCDHCDAKDTVTDEGSKKEHTFDTTKYNYTSQGHYHNCKDCGAISEITAHSTEGTCVCGYVADCDHSGNLNEVPATAATCTANGNKAYYVCADCGIWVSINTENEISEIEDHSTVVIPAAHTNIVKDVAVAATCTATGLSEGSHCAACNTVIVAQTEVAKKAHTTIPVEGKAATCTEDGLTEGEKCTKCQTILNQTVIPATGHIEVTSKKATPATCLSEGTTAEISCSVCKMIVEGSVAVPKLDTHVIVTDAAVAATCQKEGLTEGSHCSVCNEVLVAQQTVPVTAHEYETTTVAVTCTAEGHVLHDCKNCDNRYTTDVVVANGHTVDDTKWTIVTEALTKVEGKTCEYTGVKKTNCAVESCGAEITKEYTAIKHTYTSSVTTPATCVSEGVKTYTCECGDTYTETIAKADHVWGEAVEGKQTCTVEGCTASKVVVSSTENTSAALNKDTINSAEGSDIEVALKDATIKMDTDVVGGLKDKDVNLSAEKVEGSENTYDFNLTEGEGSKVEFTGTMTITLPYTLAEGEDPDNIFVWYLPDDGGEAVMIAATYFVGEDGQGYVTFTTDHFSKFQMRPATREELCKHGRHSLKQITTAPDCLHDGYDMFICEYCGDIDKSDRDTEKYPGYDKHDGKFNRKEKLGHKFADAVTAPTCIAMGYTTHTCSDCGYSYIDSYTDVIAHTYGEAVVVGATCYSEGTSTLTCTVEGCGYKQITYTAVLPHTWATEGTVTKAATCHDYGVMTYACTVDGCGATKTGYVPATGHAHLENIAAVNPTCEATGSTAGVKCVDCGEMLVPVTTIAALGHVEVTVPGVAATCTAEGKTEGKKCAVCNTITVAQETIPTIEHTGVEVAAKAPTCTEAGYTKSAYCSVCKTVLLEAYVIDALNHSRTVIMPAVEATETATGLTEGLKCADCGLVLVPQKVIAATEKLVYSQTFDFDDNADSASVLEEIGWTQLTKEANGVYNETNAKFEIKNGKLYFYNYGDGFDGKDGYWIINALDDDALSTEEVTSTMMAELFAGIYTYQYEVTYTSAKNLARYAAFQTEMTDDGLRYNTFHFRVGGYGNNQCHFDGAWYMYEAYDPEIDLYAAATDDSNELYPGTSIASKLLGIKYDKDAAAEDALFLNKTVMIRVEVDGAIGQTVYMKTADMADFIKISEPNNDGTGAHLWDEIEGDAFAFKIGAAVNGYIDNFYLWADSHVHEWGESTFVTENTGLTHGYATRTCTTCSAVDSVWHEHAVDEWKVTTDSTCIAEGVQEATCTVCQAKLTDVVAKKLHVWGENGLCTTEGCGIEKFSQGLKYTLKNDGTYTVTGIGSCEDTEIIIPATYEGAPVTIIGSNAFRGNTTITSVVIPEGVTAIYGYAFSGCTALTKVTVPSTLTYSWGSTILNNTAVEYTEFNNGKYLCNKAGEPIVLIDVIDTTVETFTIAPTTRLISNFVFTSCKALTALEIPDSVVYVGQGVISKAKAMESLTVAEGNKTYYSENNYIIHKASATIVAGIGDKAIPAGVTVIGVNAFAGRYITSLMIPEGITSIDSLAFQNCDDLTAIYLPKSVDTIKNNVLINTTQKVVVYYEGTEEDWAKISISSDNDEWNANVTVVYDVCRHEYGDDSVCDKCGEKRGKLVFSETFDDMADSTDSDAILAALGWKKLTKAENGVYNETNCVFEIKDGKLYYTNNVDGAKDGYYMIESLHGEHMTELFAGAYTLQYDLMYTGARDNQRYAALVTEFSADAQCYNSFHFRVRGKGDHQAHFYGSWKTFSAIDLKKDLYPAADAADGSEGTPILTKLLGLDWETYGEKLNFVNVPITIRLQWQPGMGHNVFMKTADMDAFIQVSEPSVNANGYHYADAWVGEAIVFKLGARINGYIDNIYLWEGTEDLESAHEHTFGEWTKISDPTCTTDGRAERTCEGCGMVDVQLVNATGHTCTAWTVTTPATCLAEGVESATCDVCTAACTRTIAKLAHVFSEDGKCTYECGTYKCSESVHVWGEDGLCIYGCGTEKFSQGLKYTTLSNGTLAVSGIGTCTDTEIIIPAVYNGVKVTEILSGAFRDVTTITSVIISEGVSAIGNNAFNGCTSLVNVELPSTMRTLANSVFRNCTALTAIKLPDNLATIGTYTFYGCTALTTVKLPAKLTAIGNYFFYKCTALEAIEIPEGVTSIGNYAFAYCTTLKDIVIPEGVTAIGDSAFAYSQALETITLPNSLSTIGTVIFNGNVDKDLVFTEYENGYYLGNESNPYLYFKGPIDKSMTAITMHPMTKFIGYMAFDSCTALETYTVPSNVIAIGEYAFDGCTALAKVTIPSSVIHIGNGLFRGTSDALTEIVIENNAYYHVAGNCIIETATGTLIAGTNNSVIPDDGSVKIIGNNAFQSLTIESIVIPEGVTALNNLALQRCFSLKEIYLPKSLKTISGNAFLDSPLTTVYYYGSMEDWFNIKIGTASAEVLNACEIIYNYCPEHSYGDDDVCDLCGGEKFKMIYSQTFDGLENSTDTDAVLAALGWTKLTKAEHGVYNETNALFEIRDGKLYYTNNIADGKDGYYRINDLYGDHMTELFGKEYTLQYDVMYTSAGNNQRYAIFVTEFSEDAQCYNSFHFRVRGKADHQAHFYGTWKTYSAVDKADLNPAADAADGSEGTPILTKLLGLDWATYGAEYNFVNVPVTIRLHWNPGVGHDVYMKTAYMDQFIHVSTPSVNADGMMYAGSWDGNAIVFKLGGKIDGYVDNLFIWTGDEHDHSWSEWETTRETSCAANGELERVCADCGMVEHKAIKMLDAHAYGDDDVCDACGHRQQLEYAVYKDGTLGVIGIGEVTVSDIVIPSEVNGVKVTRIYANAFKGNKDITSVVISDGILTVGVSAFQDCTALESVTLGNGVEILYGQSFRNCTALKSISIPASVKSINGHAFYGCTSLATVELAEGLTQIARYAFYDCDALESVTIPESVTSIGDYAFANCNKLTKIDLPSNLTELGEYALGPITDKAFSLTLTEYENGKYYGNEENPYMILMDVVDTKATTFTIPETTKFIYDYAMQNCSSVTEIKLPEGLTKIGYYGLANMSGVKEITIPASVTSIDAYAFNNWQALETITVAAGNTVYTVDGNCLIETATKTLIAGTNNSVIPADGSVEVIADGAFRGRVGLTEITIPDTVTTIGYDGFWDCTSLTALHIPSSVTSIRQSLTVNCDALTSLTVDPANTVYYSENNCVIETATKTLIAGCATSVIPKDVTAIGGYAFRGMDIAELTIPESVTSIGNYAFSYNEALTELVIPDSVTKIGNYAFRNNTALQSVVYSNSVNAIPSYAFAYCYALTSFTVPESVTSIGTYAFDNCRALADVKIPDTVTSIGIYAFRNCDALTSIDFLPSGITTISNYMFWNCNGLIDIEIPEQITAIGTQAFGNCSDLTSVIIHENVTAINSGAFRNCDNLTTVFYTGTKEQWSAIKLGSNNDPLLNAKIYYEVTFDENGKPIVVESLDYTELSDGTLAVAGIGNVTATDIVIPAEVDGVKVTQINGRAFYNNDIITSVVISEGIKSIGSQAFYGCDALTTMSVPSSLTKLGSSALSNQVQNLVEYQNGLYCGNETNPYVILVREKEEAPTEMVLHENTKFIYDSAFVNDHTITSITLPEGLLGIGNSAFSCCQKLTALHIPASVTDIAPYAFYATSQIAQITVADGNTVYHAFGNCLIETATKTIIRGCMVSVIPADGTVSAIGESAFSACYAMTQLTIPEGIISIGAYAFDNCMGLTELLIPSTVTKIGAGALMYTDGIETLTVAEGNTCYYVEENCLIERETKTLVAGRGTSVIPDDVGVIGANAFQGYDKITSLVIPDGVTRIGDSAFFNCSGMTSIVIPSTVVSIGYSAFYNCSALATINFTGTEAQWQAITVDVNNDALTNATIVYNYVPAAQ